ncbi:malto-oligosyltrehalose synthase [Profundibacterium mesophilum]|uniref:Alpha-glucosidase n=1 Tax=Profundibacterium mesophilum KAUST100406-0324 TaxID=1037889 RepID=A0A921NPH6_9RHOB|nr:malto-oligosyltrehalose synthase [Profundibacterium mesophilum]KAF0676041.1 alpha-glucosidase [Profundibacterium mesophilum KAUST100406-0324]
MSQFPTACYRLQFREEMDFDRAAALVPYLRELGISHLYAAPLFTATPGSTHGYDVTDPGEIEPAIGGRAGLSRLSQALREAGMGLILDIVPNHMAFSVATPWLRDVLRHGQRSRYGAHFDIDWSAPKLLLPWLEAPFAELLEKGAFGVDKDDDGPVLTCGDLRVPVAGGAAFEAARGGDADKVSALHDAQPWRLTHWKTETDAITHRRFFNVTGLIGVKVETPEVFDDVHALLFELVADGTVDGVRIDHIDGLADPSAYLEKLTRKLGDVPVWVEKILTGPESLPDWPVAGTTGYVAARAFARLLTDARGLTHIDALYRSRTGRQRQFREVLDTAKRQIITHDLSAELWRLHSMLSRIAVDDPVAAEFGPEMLRRAIVDFIAGFPRYRTYMTDETVHDEDRALIEETAAAAIEAASDPGAIPFLAQALLDDGELNAQLRLRFQQVTGAAIAKSQEDTAFYRDTRLLSANEVGGEPDAATLGTEGFHEAMERRAQDMPQGLTLTSSHDTKRSEDARLRIAAITHAPAIFERFHEDCAALAGPGVGDDLKWYLAQTLLAMHPASAATEDPRADLERRLSGHVEKALREAKRVTFWTAPDPEVEDAARAYGAALAEHFTELPQSLAPLTEIAERLSLVQTALKLTVPGIPDIYQGCEIGSFLLTDPDNRAAIDFDRLAAALDDPSALPDFDRTKLSLTRTLLRLRREHPALFAQGAYTPFLPAPGLLGFTRTHEGTTLKVCVSTGKALPQAPVEGRVWPRREGTESPVVISLTMP